MTLIISMIDNDGESVMYCDGLSTRGDNVMSKNTLKIIKCKGYAMGCAGGLVDIQILQNWELKSKNNYMKEVDYDYTQYFIDFMEYYKDSVPKYDDAAFNFHITIVFDKGVNPKGDRLVYIEPSGAYVTYDKFDTIGSGFFTAKTLLDHYYGLNGEISEQNIEDIYFETMKNVTSVGPIRYVYREGEIFNYKYIDDFVLSDNNDLENV